MAQVSINTKLTQSEVDDYWRVLNMTQRAWMDGHSAGKRHEIVLLDLLEKQRIARGKLDDARESRESE